MAFSQKEYQQIILEKDQEIKRLKQRIQDLVDKLEINDQDITNRAKQLLYLDWRNKNGQWLEIFLQEYFKKM